jgi:hypothetical protein
MGNQMVLTAFNGAAILRTHPPGAAGISAGKPNVWARLSQGTATALPIVKGCCCNLVPGEVRTTQERKMWKIGEVEPVRVMGAEGYPYGFNVITEDGKPLVSFAYASRALAEAAATHLESALLNAISVHPYAE